MMEKIKMTVNVLINVDQILIDLQHSIITTKMVIIFVLMKNTVIIFWDMEVYIKIMIMYVFINVIVDKFGM